MATLKALFDAHQGKSGELRVKHPGYRPEYIVICFYAKSAISTDHCWYGYDNKGVFCSITDATSDDRWSICKNWEVVE